MKKKYADQFSYANLESCFDKKVVKVKSKGIDKKSANSFKKNKENELKILEKKIQSGTFTFSPYLELLRVKRRDANPRMLSLPTIRDRIVLSTLKEILHIEFSDCVNKSLPNSYIRRVKKYLHDNKGHKIYYLKADITQFYDKVNRTILMNKLKERISDADLLAVLKSAIETPTVPSNYRRTDLKVYVAENGIPQGLSISNILAQIYLKSFDDYFKRKLKSSFYLRYVDDILILSKSDCNPLKKSIEEKLKLLGLSLNEKKTDWGNLEEGTEFLSYWIKDGIVSITDKKIENHVNKVAAKLAWYKKGMADPKERPRLFFGDDKKFKWKFLQEVNEIITGSKSAKKNYGWLFYFSEIEDVSVFHRVDKIIASMFTSLKLFKHKTPKKLKRTVRAYYEIKFNRGGSYVNDYDKLRTRKKRRDFLNKMAVTDPSKTYSEKEENDLFEAYRDGNLNNLERNIGYGY